MEASSNPASPQDPAAVAHELPRALSKYWWALVLRGVLAIVFGILCFTQPDMTLAVLVLFVGAWLLVDGVFTIVHGFKAEKKWPHFLYGALGVAAGLVTFLSPGLTALSLLVLIGVWSIFKGAMEIYLAIRLRRDIEREWLLVLAGALSVLFGVLVLVNPGSGALAVLWLIGLYAVLFGILLLFLGFRLRGWKETPAEAAPA